MTTPTTIVNAARLQRLQDLQDARDQLSEQIADAEAALMLFRGRLQGPTPESGDWLEWLRMPINAQVAADYDTTAAHLRELKEALEANVAESRAVEAQPADEDALTTLLTHLAPVLRSYAGAEGEDVPTAMAEIGRVYRALRGEP